jgi:hypothetical protein
MYTIFEFIESFILNIYFLSDNTVNAYQSNTLLIQIFNKAHNMM